MSFAIVVDSTGELTPAEAAEHGINIISLTISLDGKDYCDQVDVTSEEFLDLMAASDNLPTTTQPSPYDFSQLYARLAEEGAEAIISIHISAPLSGTVQSAALAAKDAPVPVHVIDSCGVTAWTGLMARHAAALRDQGLDADQTAEAIRTIIKKAHFTIAPDTLENLLKGGRLSPLEAKAAGLLNIKPLIGFDEIGTLISTGKVRGMNGVIKTFANEIADFTAKEGTQAVRFCHTGNAAALDEVKRQLSEKGVEYVDYGTTACGATVATHLGLGAIGYACLPVNEG